MGYSATENQLRKLDVGPILWLRLLVICMTKVKHFKNQNQSSKKVFLRFTSRQQMFKSPPALVSGFGEVIHAHKYQLDH